MKSCCPGKMWDCTQFWYGNQSANAGSCKGYQQCCSWESGWLGKVSDIYFLFYFLALVTEICWPRYKSDKDIAAFDDSYSDSDFDEDFDEDVEFWAGSSKQLHSQRAANKRQGYCRDQWLSYIAMSLLILLLLLLLLLCRAVLIAWVRSEIQSHPLIAFEHLGL